MKRIILPIYCYSLFDDIIFIYPLYVVMFNKYGLSAFQISVLLAVWSTVAFVLEIPSGAIADKYSRKHILLFGQIIRMLGYACWILFPTFWVIMDVVLESRLQHSINGDARATVLSVRGFMEEIAAVIIYMGFGAVASKCGYPTGFQVCAIAMMFIGMLWLLFSGRNPFEFAKNSLMNE